MPNYKLSIDEPWDFIGPDGPNLILVEELGIVHGPNLPNWEGQELLLRVLHPFQVDGEEVKLLLASPRYRGSTINDLLNKSTPANIGRVHPGCSLAPGDRYAKGEVVFWGIGGITKIIPA